MLKRISSNSPEELELYSDIFLRGFEYLGLAYEKDSDDYNRVGETIKEVYEKGLKLVETRKQCHNAIIKARLELEQASPKVDASSSREFSSAVENFLSQGKAMLDLLANQYFSAIYADFKGKWNHKNICNFISSREELKNNAAAQELCRLLNEDYVVWLGEFIDDRNVQHECNFKVSDFVVRNGKLHSSIKRASGKVTEDIVGYVDTGYQNIIGLTKDFIYLVLCLKNPVIFGLDIPDDYFGVKLLGSK